MSQTDSPLVSPQWVAQQLGSPDLAILDASWHLPAAGRDPRAEFTQGHIPGAVMFDIDAISDPASGLPHMLPDAPSFAKAMGALGVSDNMTIVVYDSLGVFSAPRAWWSLQTFGARKLYMLDGGLPAWRAAGLPIESGEAEPEPAIFNAQLNSGAVASIEDVAAALKNDTAQVADARSAERFSGAAPEPRPGLPSGHMPGARNLPIGKLAPCGALGDRILLGRECPPEGFGAFDQLRDRGAYAAAQLLKRYFSPVRKAHAVAVGACVQSDEGNHFASADAQCNANGWREIIQLQPRIVLDADSGSAIARGSQPKTARGEARGLINLTLARRTRGVHFQRVIAHWRTLLDEPAQPVKVTSARNRPA